MIFEVDDVFQIMWASLVPLLDATWNSKKHIAYIMATNEDNENIFLGIKPSVSGPPRISLKNPNHHIVVMHCESVDPQEIVKNRLLNESVST